MDPQKSRIEIARVIPKKLYAKVNRHTLGVRTGTTLPTHLLNTHKAVPVHYRHAEAECICCRPHRKLFKCTPHPSPCASPLTVCPCMHMNEPHQMGVSLSGACFVCVFACALWCSWLFPAEACPGDHSLLLSWYCPRLRLCTPHPIPFQDNTRFSDSQFS